MYFGDFVFGLFGFVFEDLLLLLEDKELVEDGLRLPVHFFFSLTRPVTLLPCQLFYIMNFIIKQTYTMLQLLHHILFALHILHHVFLQVHVRQLVVAKVTHGVLALILLGKLPLGLTAEFADCLAALAAEESALELTNGVEAEVAVIALLFGYLVGVEVGRQLLQFILLHPHINDIHTIKDIFCKPVSLGRVLRRCVLFIFPGRSHLGQMLLQL